MSRIVQSLETSSRPAVDFDKARKLGPEVPSRIAMHRLQPEAFPDRGALLGETEDALRLAERSCSLSEP